MPYEVNPYLLASPRPVEAGVVCPFVEPGGSEWWEKAESVFDDPIIIGGCERSGSGLLARLLNKHPELYIGCNTQLCQPSTSTFLDRQQDFGTLSAQLDAPTSLFFDCYKASASHSQARMVSMILGNLCLKADKTRWGEQTPANVRVVKWVFDHFQNAQFVHVVRDGRDVACSLERLPGAQQGFEGCANQWILDVRHGVAWCGNPRYYQVRYEDLVQDPEQALRPLLAWLNMAWAPEVLSEPLTTKHVGRWRTETNTAQREYFRRHGGKLLVDLGYVPPSYL